MSISIANIKIIVYFHKNNRITLQNLLNLCYVYDGIRRVTVGLLSGRRVKIGIRKAKQSFMKGQVNY